ncbi:hypothetical protein [Chelativorans salis]|uniref:Uncharacterized protein n=1 Tax=Chelativorans salis TaxID=2978478 RepID=A0ABT2LUA1_9HYPH|nr:hypothetical protein [Chelativorans sp. EGI FJ00035]MCT7377188.1 hypothetical protein [Chelativorans sp. EGI FJ00035]
MKTIILAGIFALAASTSLAQTDTEPGATEGEAPATAEATDTQQADAGRPANLCQELLAFVRENPPEADDAQGNPPEADAPADQSAAAGEDSSPASGEAVPPQPSSESSSAQEQSGQSGPAHEAPDPNTEAATQSNGEDAPQTSGLSAPVPPEASEAEEDVPLNLDRAEELADANDIVACKDAARKLRLAGAAMPPPLLALTALDLQYQTRETEAETPAQQTQPQQ